MNTKIQKIDYAIFHEPTLIPTLMRDCSIRKGIIYSRLRRAVPRRVGIEFECIGNPIDVLRVQTRSIIKSAEDIINLFRLKDYSQDYGFARSLIDEAYRLYVSGSDDSIGDTTINTNTSSEMSTINELRVSISDYHQLIGLYNILKLFKQSCEIPEGGGIHIHIDFSDYSYYKAEDVAARYISNRLSKVEKIFPKYTGTYNKRKVGIHEKGTYVNLSYHGTIEFRIAPLTFDYETLIRWIVDCNKFVTKLIHECHLLTKDEYNKKNLSIGVDSSPSDSAVYSEFVRLGNDTYEILNSETTNWIRRINNISWNYTSGVDLTTSSATLSSNALADRYEPYEHEPDAESNDIEYGGDLLDDGFGDTEICMDDHVYGNQCVAHNLDNVINTLNRTFCRFNY